MARGERTRALSLIDRDSGGVDIGAELFGIGDMQEKPRMTEPIGQLTEQIQEKEPDSFVSQQLPQPEPQPTPKPVLPPESPVVQQPVLSPEPPVVQQPVLQPELQVAPRPVEPSPVQPVQRPQPPSEPQASPWQGQQNQRGYETSVPYQNQGMNQSYQQPANDMPMNGYQQMSGQMRGYTYPELQRPEPSRIQFKKLITVYSPKGGVGKSSITKELAAAFSTAHVYGKPLKILVVDADWEFGDVSTLFNVAPRPCVSDWIRDMMAERQHSGTLRLYSRQEISRYIIPWSEHLHILAGPHDPMEAELVTEEVVQVIVESLRRSDYDLVLIDSANSNRGRTLSTLTMSDAVVLVETLDTSTVAETATVLNTLRSRQYDFSKIYMVLNQVPDNDNQMDISVAEIARLLQLDIAGIIPRYEGIRVINNAGQAAVLKKSTNYSEAIFSLANRLIPVFDEKKKKGLFSFIGQLRKGRRR